MWHRASPLRGSIPLQYPADAPDITALTCTAPGQCTALGAYATSANSQDSVPVDGPLFEAVQAHGTWSAIHAVRGLPAGRLDHLGVVCQRRELRRGRVLAHQPHRR